MLKHIYNDVKKRFFFRTQANKYFVIYEGKKMYNFL